MLHLSPGEIHFLKDGIHMDIRADGRSRLDYRPFTLETGILAQANGSSRLILDATTVMVGVKAEIGAPDPMTPNSGSISVSVQCSPSASPEFEGRGGESLNTELAQFFERCLQSKGVLDLRSLSLLDGKQCWILHVDVIVLDSSGNLFDSIAIAIRGALLNTTLPHVDVSIGEDNKYEFEVDQERIYLLYAECVPVCVSLALIGDDVVVDATLEEELCQDCRVTFAVNKQGNVVSTHKGSGSLPLNAFGIMLKTATDISKRFFSELLKIESMPYESAFNKSFTW
jgi:exosome complex component RRP42